MATARDFERVFVRFKAILRFLERFGEFEKGSRVFVMYWRDWGNFEVFSSVW